MSLSMKAFRPVNSMQFAALREKAHPRCVVCSRSNPIGLGLEFALQTDGSVVCEVAVPDIFEGYSGRLHGGVVAALLDGAMTNCLFAQGKQAVTAELRVRYRHPVMTHSRVTVRARLTKVRVPLYVLEAEVLQEGQIRASASAKFMEMSAEARRSMDAPAS